MWSVANLKEMSLEYNGVYTREFCENKAKFEEACRLLIAMNEYEVKNSVPPSEYPHSLKLCLEILYQQNSNTIFEHAESPIEIIFLNALSLCFIRNSLPLVIVPNVSDTMRYIDELKTFIPQIKALAKYYKDQGYEGEDVIKLSALWKKNNQISQKERATMLRVFTTYEWLGLERAYHLVIQAGFPQILNGKNIRTDLFFWLPQNDNFKLVVECDGYKYHNTQFAFTRDRKRDRVLQNQGMQVMRFSGSEINSDPLGVATELFKFLFRQSNSFA